LVHGPEETATVIAASQALFGRGELRQLDPDVLGAALTEASYVEVSAPLPSVIDLLTQTGLAASRSAARRTVDEGGAYLNNVRVSDGEAVPTAADLLPGGWLVLRRGKRQLAGVHVDG
jgi:tyrosyl-tRNA synthetase